MHISLVVPVLNEEEAIPLFYKAVRGHDKLKKYAVEIVFCNDGSTDKTEKILEDLALSDSLVKPIHFTRNFGKEIALFAGLEHATGAAIVPMDVDLQDPIDLIPKMLEKWEHGADVVLAKRIDRTEDHPLKRMSSSIFYKLHNYISSNKIEENVGDFRLISRDVCDVIINMPERNLFMKGILSWVGGNVDIVEYSRPRRISGKTKFNGWKLWNLALEGITGFSTVPLRVWTYLGILIASISFFYGIWIIGRTLIQGSDMPGYPSLLVCILFLGGVQLISIGMLGEYLGRVYIETKKRPRYVLKRIKSIQTNKG